MEFKKLCIYIYIYVFLLLPMGIIITDNGFDALFIANSIVTSIKEKACRTL